MAQDRSNLLAKTFLLPQQQVNYQQPVQQPYDDGVQALEGLQVVQGQTTDYYKKVSALKSFMQSVNKNLGIDVRVPDLSRPESIELNQIYQKALADILAQGNELKQSSGIYSMLINRGDHLTKGAYDKPAARFQHGVDYYGGVDKAITETNDFTSTPSYDKQEYDQKREIYTQRKKEYEKLRDENPDKKEYYDYQLRALTPPAQRQYRPYNESSYDQKLGQQAQTGSNWVKKITNLVEGAHDSFEPDKKQIDVDGEPYLISTEFAGTKYGNGILQFWRFKPSKNKLEMAIQLPNGSITYIPKGKGDIQDLVMRLSGLPAEAIDKAARDNNWYDDYGQINKSKVLGEDYQKLIAANKEKIEGATHEVAYASMKEALSKIQPHTWKLMSPETWNSDNDDKIQIGKFLIAKRAAGSKVGGKKRVEGGYEITNIKDVLPYKGLSVKEANALQTKNSWWSDNETSFNELMSFLVSHNAHMDFYKTKYPDETVKPGTQIAPQQPANNPIDW